MFVVVTTFYTLDSMKSILLPKFVFFSFQATPFSQKYKFIILLFYLNSIGCCTSYYNMPTSLYTREAFAKPIITQIGRENNVSAEIYVSRTVEDAGPYNL